MPEPLSQRMRRGQCLELREYLVVAPALQLGLDPRFERAEPLLLEPRPLGSGKAAVAHVGERRAPPQAERPIEELHRPCRIATCDRRPPRGHELLELEQVELVGGGVEHVAGRPGHQPIGFTGGAQRTAELRQAYLKIGRAPAPARARTIVRRPAGRRRRHGWRRSAASPAPRESARRPRRPAARHESPPADRVRGTAR